MSAKAVREGGRAQPWPSGDEEAPIMSILSHEHSIYPQILRGTEEDPSAQESPGNHLSLPPPTPSLFSHLIFPNCFRKNSCHYKANSLSVKTSLISQPQPIKKGEGRWRWNAVRNSEQLLHSNLFLSKKLGKTCTRPSFLHCILRMPGQNTWGVFWDREFVRLPQGPEALPGQAFCCGIQLGNLPW